MSDDTIRVALICFDNPFLKPMEGGKRSMMTRIQSLSRIEDISVDVYLLCKHSEGKAETFHNVDQRAKFYQYSMNQTSPVMLLSGLPICVNKRFVKECVEELRKHQYDVAIYEGEQVSSYRLKNVVNAKKHILYFHDIESQYRKAIADTAENYIKRIANLRESKQFERIEQRLDTLFDAFWFISKDECAQIKNHVRGECVYIPAPASELSEKATTGDRSPVMLYVGDLSVTHNYLSLKWFVDEVMPIVKKHVPFMKCEIVGRVNEENKKALQNEYVHVLGYVDDLEAIYDDAACIISPVLYGAGVKIKVIDALGKGQIVITTSKGVEGTELENGKHLLVADDPEELANICIDVLKNRVKYTYIAAAGHEFVKKYHSIEHQADLISSQLSKLCKNIH